MREEIALTSSAFLTLKSACGCAGAASKHESVSRLPRCSVVASVAQCVATHHRLPADSQRAQITNNFVFLVPSHSRVAPIQ